MSTPEETLSDFVSTLQYDDVPPSARGTIRRAFLDTVGVTLAGAVTDAAASVFEAGGVTPRDVSAATLLGLDPGTPATERALRVGTAGHALDYDDLSWGMDGHPSVTLVPPLLALSADTDATGSDLLTGYAAGFEVECALAEPISPEHYEAGWHATATFGSLGATAAAANLLGLDPTETRHALNTAASTAAGLKRNFGSATKPLHAGRCARAGVTAATLAAEGHTADPTAVSGDRGFWELYGPSNRDEFAFDPADWALDRHGIHTKYYPCCYFTHTAIAATQSLVDEHDIDGEAIERVHVRASQGAADALTHTDPDTSLEAKFSMEYAVACGAVRDRVGLDAFESDVVDDPDVQAVRERVQFETDSDLHYDAHDARVRVVTASDSYERSQENPPGTHDDPPSEAALRRKFEECAERAVSGDELDRLEEVFARVDDCERVASAVRG